MKVNISKSNLINAVNIASKAVPAKTTLPILECILIDASTEKIKFMANDEELGIETIQDGTILEHGIIAIDAAIFGNIVRKLPDGMDVTLETDGEQVTIRSGKIVFSISGRDGSDFPYLPEIDRSYSIEVSELTLRDIITKTIFAISTNDTNQLMTGELFEIRNREQLRVAALDGHRISVRSVELKESYEDKKVIIPGKTLTEISKILDPNPEEMVHVYLADKHAMFQFGTTTVVTRLIEGTYFNVDQMISGDYNTHVRINRQAFLSCLDRATLPWAAWMRTSPSKKRGATSSSASIRDSSWMRCAPSTRTMWRSTSSPRGHRRLSGTRAPTAISSCPSISSATTDTKERIIMEIKIRDEYIRLGQAMKLAGLVENGVEAKDVITDGEVTVNGETETRRGKKLRDGDSFSYGGKTVTVRAGGGPTQE